MHDTEVIERLREIIDQTNYTKHKGIRDVMIDDGDIDALRFAIDCVGAHYLQGLNKRREMKTADWKG